MRIISSVNNTDGLGIRDSSVRQCPLEANTEDRAEYLRNTGAGFKMVHPDYFRVLGILVIKGRGFTDRDVKGAPPVTVVNQTFVNREPSRWVTLTGAALAHVLANDR